MQKGAKNYGMELEVRKSFSGFTSLLEGLMFVGNISLIKS
jgi:hypothetical protein